MKCTDKQRRFRFAAFAAAGILLFSGCGTKTYEMEHPYDVYGTSIHYEQPSAGEAGLSAAQGLTPAGNIPFFAQDLCISESATTASGTLDASAAEAAGVFHLDEKTVPYAKIFLKNYIRPVRPKYLPRMSRLNTRT